ncbi:g5442 [Coccomyxa viridis]|uniref:G5442 protein n=1 Tax=Coccomyxa viridis TaxID=1274662 RepID=A0ABP1FXZ6_9CHLO
MSTGISIKLAGCAKSSVNVESFETTVQQLKSVIAQALGCSPATLKLILGGKRLQDDSSTLKACGVTAGKPILVLGAVNNEQHKQLASQEQQAHQGQQRTERLDRLRKAAKALAQRSGNSTMGNEDFHDVSLETQDGQPVLMNDTDREALVMGMTLHDKAQQFLQKEEFREALDVLLLAEESFQCCKDDLLKYIDNLGLLLMDTVWCFFQLRDEQSLAAAQERLAQARQCFARSHGPNQERIKVLHGNFCPELAMYVRLELLEGVAAYYSGNKALAQAKLKSSEQRWQQLQVSDERLAELMSMGFKSQEAKRSLRFCQGNAENAITFILEQRKAQDEQKQRAREEKRLRRERRGYGRSCRGEHVNMDSLAALSQLGYSRPLVAEALKQAENDIQQALDLLSSPMCNAALQQALVASSVDPQGLSLPSELPPAVYQSHAAFANEIQTNGESSSQGRVEAAAAAKAADTHMEAERDADAEEELTSAARSDPFAAYDVEVAREGEAIREYMALLDLDVDQGPGMHL